MSVVKDLDGKGIADQVGDFASLRAGQIADAPIVPEARGGTDDAAIDVAAAGIEYGLADTRRAVRRGRVAFDEDRIRAGFSNRVGDVHADLFCGFRRDQGDDYVRTPEQRLQPKAKSPRPASWPLQRSPCLSPRRL